METESDLLEFRQHGVKRSSRILTSVEVNMPSVHWDGRSCLLLALFTIIFIVIVARSATLTCRRFEHYGPVNCSRQTRLLWVIPFGTTEIRQVRAARVSQSIDDEGVISYRVELVTAQHRLPVTSTFAHPYDKRGKVASKLNDFINSTEPGTVVVMRTGMLTTENIVFGIVWLVICLFLRYINKR